MQSHLQIELARANTQQKAESASSTRTQRSEARPFDRATRPLRLGLRLLAIVGALIGCAVAASGASAYVYWSASANNTIMRANNDGTNVITFIQGASAPAGVAVTGSYVYWSNWANGDIGRANIDGTDVNQQFITGGDHPDGIAVEGNYLYWANYGTGLHSIGRANLDGTGVNQQFVVMPIDPSHPTHGDANPSGLAADANYLYVTEPSYQVCNAPYYTRCTGGSIGRIALDGTSRNYTFISPNNSGFPQGIAVSASMIYWQDYAAGYIESANIDGSSINTAFQADPARKWAGGIALDGSYIYWAQSDANSGGAGGATGSIGRATLDDYNANQWFIGTSAVAYGQPWGIAVDGLAPPPTPGPGAGPGPSPGPHPIPGGPGPSPAPGPNPPAPAVPTSCVVPKLIGLTVPQARHALTEAGCRLGKVTRRRQHHGHHGRVISSSPNAGKQLAVDAQVSILVSK